VPVNLIIILWNFHASISFLSTLELVLLNALLKLCHIIDGLDCIILLVVLRSVYLYK
jgi:hypothetical protein